MTEADVKVNGASSYHEKSFVEECSESTLNSQKQTESGRQPNWWTPNISQQSKHSESRRVKRVIISPNDCYYQREYQN